MKMETVNCEFKEKYTDETKKTVIAFLNTNGGKILIGIDNLGKIVGLENADDVVLQVISSVKDSIKPDPMMFANICKESIDDKVIVTIEVNEGSAKPYYLVSKGMKPSGVFIRVDSASIPATEEYIRKLIKENDGDKFLNNRSLEQNITFEMANKLFNEEKLKFEEEQKITLGLRNLDSCYTNLGLLISDQCKHTIKVAVFEGNTKTIFKSRKEFVGSVFKQLQDALEYIDFFNKIRAEITSLKRVETRDYDPKGIREALVNAIIHRDYSFSGSILVNIYDDRIEFVSLGGIIKGLSIEAIIRGISETRNEKLAKIFYKVNIVEAYGTGIPRIFEGYVHSTIKPKIEVTDSTFIITLPNNSYNNKMDTEDRILQYIKEKGMITREELSGNLEIGLTQCFNILTKLENAKRIKSEKKGRKKVYYLI